MIAVTITTTARQDARLAEFLTEVNSVRVAQGDPPYPDINTLATDLLRTQLVSWVRSMDTRETERVKVAYDGATTQTQTQVKALLGVS